MEEFGIIDEVEEKGMNLRKCSLKFSIFYGVMENIWFLCLGMISEFVLLNFIWKCRLKFEVIDVGCLGWVWGCVVEVEVCSNKFLFFY